MEDQKPVRKPTRLSTIDYRDPGAYFITTCTQAMKLYFSPVGADIIRDFKRQATIEYIKLVKSGLAAPFDGKLWQRSFYDHVIRNQQDFDEIYRYISENPTRWEFDKFYSEA